MNKDQKQLLNQAMKYKNMFESYEINTGAYQIENIAFYLVVYSKKILFQKKITGSAVISTEFSDSVEESKYVEAYNLLTDFALLKNMINTHVFFIADINMDSFKTVKGFLEKVTENVEFNQKSLFLDALKANNYILELQDILMEKYNFYADRGQKIQRGEIEYITNEIMEDLYNLLCEADYIQYQQVHRQYIKMNDYKEILKISKSHPSIKKFLTYETEIYLKEFTKGKREFEDTFERITRIKDQHKLTKEEHLDLAREVLTKSVEKRKKEFAKKNRYPIMKNQ